ncbi:hypothetical protein RB195_013407 [Necator americanus]|uniref:Uncharacterized protein n=1 Tax=Necator americanus TaxID=51031 RepID=A0ABR1DVC1_NECAM
MEELLAPARPVRRSTGVKATKTVRCIDVTNAQKVTPLTLCTKVGLQSLRIGNLGVLQERTKCIRVNERSPERTYVNDRKIRDAAAYVWKSKIRGIGYGMCFNGQPPDYIRQIEVLLVSVQTNQQKTGVQVLQVSNKNVISMEDGRPQLILSVLSSSSIPPQQIQPYINIS